ncbi:hypothetical protein [Actinoplanes sp. NPDC049681]|uniref:hypothetical protein n=1 Tax=Actinoplanes sp. NPDC049681 TaxID=3363905 RepID=UPI003787D392
MWTWLKRWTEPLRPGFGPDEEDDVVEYDATKLADAPAVVAAIARAPTTLLGITVDPARAELAVDRDDLPRCLGLSTVDGRAWELFLDDGVSSVVDNRRMTAVTEDLFELALAGQSGVVSTAHLDTEIYWLRLARPETPETVLARSIDAIVSAHRELARRLGIVLPT